jgi:hypothetical protein
MDKRKVESLTNNLIFDHKILKNRWSNNFWIKHVVWCWKVYSRATSSLLKNLSIKICMWELKAHKITRLITWKIKNFQGNFETFCYFDTILLLVTKCTIDSCRLTSFWLHLNPILEFPSPISLLRTRVPWVPISMQARNQKGFLPLCQT